VLAPAPDNFPADPMGIVEMDYFRWDLYFRPVSEAFLAACAEWIRQLSGACSIQTSKTRRQPSGYKPQLSLMMTEPDPGHYRIALKSNGDIYERPTLDIGRPIRSVAVRTAFPVTRIRPDGSTLTLPVPPHGLVVVEVSCGEGQTG
jgi:hypothetical protein